MLSHSVCNHTRDKQIGLPLRGRLRESTDFVITRMITDRIGLHSVLLPLRIAEDGIDLLGKFFMETKKLSDSFQRGIFNNRNIYKPYRLCLAHDKFSINK